MTGINPGIRRTVEWLNEGGFKTTDSGDGATHDYECDRAYPYAVIVTTKEKLIGEAERLAAALAARGVIVGDLDEEGRGPYVQAMFVPGSDVEAMIDLQNVDDALLFGEPR